MPANLIISQCSQPQGGAEGKEGAKGGGAMDTVVTFFPFVLLIVIFYFLLIRPQRKKEKERKSMIGALGKNDRIVTNGGIFGSVVSIKDPWITIKIDENNDIRMKSLRSAVAGPATLYETGNEKKDDDKGGGKNDKKS